MEGRGLCSLADFISYALLKFAQRNMKSESIQALCKKCVDFF